MPVHRRSKVTFGALVSLAGLGALSTFVGCRNVDLEKSPARAPTEAAPSPSPSSSAAPPSTTLAPAAASGQSALAPPTDGTVRLLVAGDVIAHRPVLVSEGALATALGPLQALFASADGVLVNHESSTGDAPVGKSHDLEYAAPSFWADELSRSHVTAIGLANNHACDLGRSGLLATISRAEEKKLRVVGAGEEPWRAEVVASRGGHDVCAVGWSTLTNGDPMACDKALAFAPESPTAVARVEKEIDAAKKRGCAAVIAVVHIGEEYKDQPPSVYVLGARLAEAGADAVVMHHPHVPNAPKVTVTKDGRTVPIFASLGNLVSNQGYAWKAPKPVVLPNRKQVSANAWTRVGLVADLAFAWPVAGKPAVVSFGYHVVWNDKPKLEKRGKEALLARLLTRSDRELLDGFTKDPEGPNALFASRCWRDDVSTAPSNACLEGPISSSPKTARKPSKRK